MLVYFLFGDFGSGCPRSLQKYKPQFGPLRPYPQDMKDQIHVDVCVRIWGTYYQNRPQNGEK